MSTRFPFVLRDHCTSIEGSAGEGGRGSLELALHLLGKLAGRCQHQAPGCTPPTVATQHEVLLYTRQNSVTLQVMFRSTADRKVTVTSAGMIESATTFRCQHMSTTGKDRFVCG